MMTAIHYGLKVNWGHVLFNVLKDMVDKSQKKAKGFAAQIGALLKSIPAVTMSNGVSFPSAKVLSMRTVHTYTVTNSTIDARTESEEQGMANAPIITKKRRTGKSKLSVSQAKLDIVQVATDIEPIQVVDPTPVEESVPPLVFKRKSRKRKLVLSRESDDDSVGTEEISKKADDVVVMSTVEADIARVLEETLALGVTETVQESQAFDEALFEEDFTRWLDDFIARHTEPEVISTNIGAQATGSTTLVIDKEVPMSIDDLLIQISNDRLLPTTAAEVTMLRLGPFSSSGDKGKAKLGEDDQVTDNAAMKLFALISRDVEVLVQVRDSLMQAVVDFFASFSLNSMPDMETLKDLKEKERLMMAWAETNSLAIAVRRQLYVLIKYRESLLRTILESFQSYLTPDLPWSAMAIKIANLLSVAHSQSLEDLKAQQQELNVVMMESQSSLPIIDYTDGGEIRLAHFFSIADSSCWVRPVFLSNGVWTPAQGPEFWSNSCSVSLFLDNLHIPRPAIQKLFVLLNSFITPDQYWATVPCLMRIWRWTKVCEEVVALNLSGGLRPVRKGETEEVASTGVEEVDLVSSDVSTVYCSPSPPSPEVDSFEHDMRFALGPAIFSRTEQEERLYFVQSPDSPPAASPQQASSSSSIDVSLHFDDTDIPVRAQAASQAPASVDFSKITEALGELETSLTQRIHTSNYEMLSKLSAVEMGVREDLFKMQSLLRQSFETACRVLEREGNIHKAEFNGLRKGLLAPAGTILGDLFDIKKKQREQDARLLTMDEQIAAIRNEHLEFQSKIAADMLSLSTQVGDIADFLRSGVAKKGEVGSSSRPTTVRAPTQTLPPTTGTFEERVAQARRNIIEAGQVISVEEVAARVVENDRREHERLERERRERRQSRSGTYKRRR
ncbi:TGACG-sequence-specific DNA-binding protein TGA-2.1-like [Dorcoceras hygrometricum]|uniref:TGACG-sequence-specific DNA-binding protein TGA-2.1-like n=1 Tax=Dorcoceras hygrometricum TaxID=472368 RepID=A0A2Z7BVS6_9LAMI|nr:TGACG-sequence-specific DNA-binding protein TGA-2.1-like [Dorcoceras hygrometricum]